MNKIINFIGSIKFAFPVTMLILLFSFIGSIISEASVENIKNNVFISLFFDPSTDSFRQFAGKIGLLNIYTTPLFLILLALFTLSLTICTIRLFPFAKKGFPFLSESALKDEQAYNKNKEETIDFFKKDGWKVTVDKNDNRIMKAEKHKLGKFGVIVTHFGLFFVMLGATIGYYIGFNEFMVFYEGDNKNTIETKDGSTIPLNFSLRLNKFTVEYYEGTGTAKAFLSDLTVLENGKEVLNKVIDVNHPLKYNNIVFYQASYGQSPHQNMDLHISFTYDNKTETRNLKYGKIEKVGNYNIAITNFLNHMDVDPKTNEPYNASYDFRNPAVYLTVYDDKAAPLMGGWLLLYADGPTMIDELGMGFQFVNLGNISYSGLSVKYNPGTPIVYLGGILMCIGVILIYVLNYTAVIFKVSDGVIKYKVRSQRKYPIVNPVEKFYKFIEKEI